MEWRRISIERGIPVMLGCVAKFSASWLSLYRYYGGCSGLSMKWGMKAANLHAVLPQESAMYSPAAVGGAATSSVLAPVGRNTAEF